MTLSAVDAVGDALALTRRFLWPPELHRWAKLALVTFFIGGGAGANPAQFSGSVPEDVPGTPGAPGAPDLPALGDTGVALLVAAVVGILLLVVLFRLVGAILEFVFVESLRQEEVAIRRYWSVHWKRGLRLFGFRLVLGVLVLAGVALLFVLFLGPLFLGIGEVALIALVVLLPVAAVLAVAVGVLNGFTTMFVVPIMLLEERGLLSAWRRFWPTLVGEWKEYLAYAVIGYVLQIAAGIAASIVVLVVALVVAIPFVAVGLLGLWVLTVSQPVGIVVLVVLAMLYVLALLVVSAVVAVPVQTFLRYYALLVLGETNDAFDAIPEQRQAV